ncbi:MAG TPA: VOC family protein [Solirubrobacteraceae bacterium]|jgi:predicted enzyme related to lactoylglutathione lyase|nr:VOC family protein [Solirubrobacteraceae bacterium]
MPERDGYLPGVPCWIDTTPPDPAAAVAFYGGLFGWNFEDVMPEGSGESYFIARLRGGDVGAVGSQPEGAPPMAAWNTYIAVESADDAASRVLGAGGQVLKGAFDVGDAGRMAVFADPDGAVFCVWQAKAHRGARIVNEPGSLNFNVLNTRDPQGAKAFYGSVFGWETLELGGGTEMWRLPGYGDFLESADPGLRERMAASGAPSGFEDVVASLSPIAEDQAEVAAHWGVTFAVEDADATAEKAAQLGGEVLVAPFDAPWVRMTVLADPQGAVFSASKFVPENRELAVAESSSARAA